MKKYTLLFSAILITISTNFAQAHIMPYEHTHDENGEEHRCGENCCDKDHKNENINYQKAADEILDAQIKAQGLEKFVLKGEVNEFLVGIDGKISINNHPISLDSVDAMLHLIRDENGTVSVRGETGVALNLVFDIVNRVRSSGVKMN